jgi:hypothetical protein
MAHALCASRVRARARAHAVACQGKPQGGSCTAGLLPLRFPPQVTHSTTIIGIASDDLPADAYARANNVRVAAVVPGPKIPKNLAACLIPLLTMLSNAAGGRPGMPDALAPQPLELRAAGPDGNATTRQHIPYLTSVVGDRIGTNKINGCKGPSACLSCPYCIFQSSPYAAAGGRSTYRPAGYVSPVPQTLNLGSGDGDANAPAYKAGDPHLALTHAM